MADFTVGNFFRYYVAHPNDAPKEDKAKARALTALFSIITVGIVPLAVLAISKIRWKTFDDFDHAQYLKTHQVAGQRLGASDWVKGMNQDVAPVQGHLAPTLGLDKVTDQLNHLKQFSQSHQDFIRSLQVKKERRKDKNYQFKPKVFNDLQASIKELTKLADRGNKKNVEINAPLQRAEKAIRAYEAEKIRLEELVEADNAFQKNAY